MDEYIWDERYVINSLIFNHYALILPIRAFFTTVIGVFIMWILKFVEKFTGEVMEIAYITEWRAILAAKQMLAKNCFKNNMYVIEYKLID